MTITKDETITWWERFLIENGEKEEFQRIFKKIKKVDDTTTEESLDELKEMIDGLDDEEYEDAKTNFNRKVRIFEKRLERRVNKDLGSMLKYLRESRGLSLAKLEKLTGISASYINRIELGQKKTPSFPIIEKIAKALNVSVFSLFDIASKNGKEKSALSIAEVIYSNNIFIDEDKKPINLATKEQLIDIIQFITQMQWKENKHTEMLKLLEMIDEFK